MKAKNKPGSGIVSQVGYSLELCSPLINTYLKEKQALIFFMKAQWIIGDWANNCCYSYLQTLSKLASRAYGFEKRLEKD